MDARTDPATGGLCTVFIILEGVVRWLPPNEILDVSLGITIKGIVQQGVRV